MYGMYFLGKNGGKMDVTHKIFRDQPDFIEDSTAPWQQLVDEDLHFKVFLDRYPVTPGHLLFVPKYNTLSVLQEVFDAATRKGKAMVMVSHNRRTIEKACQRFLVFREGTVEEYDSFEEAYYTYKIMLREAANANAAN